MSDRLKRILFVSFFVILVAGIGIGLYLVFFRPKTTAPAEGTGTTEGTEIGGAESAFPSAGAGNAQNGGGETGGSALPNAETVSGGQAGAAETLPRTMLLVEGVSQGIAPTADGTGARFYNPVDGKFYRAYPDGRIVAMSDTAFMNVESVTWGNESDQAVLAFPDGSKIHYDFQTGKQETLPKHWEDFDFSADDRSVIAKSEAISPESRYLVISDPDGKNPRAVQPLGESGDKVHSAWTGGNDVVAYSETGEALGYDRQQIILLGKNNENYPGLVVEGRGFTPLWSPSGQKILYSAWTVDNGYRPELWVSGGSPDTVNKNRVKLELQTWATKCVWANEDLIYCAVPLEMPRGAGLQPSLFANLEDRVIKIDLKTGQKTDLGQPEGNPSMRNLVVTKDGTELIYTDASTGKMYAFRVD
jgi:hypothetical protein